ncbi:hypothetical protein FACS189485_18640 [Spirochaetia bacterium]|nr:hypothetical protein FACS189485_18640 [Spirochaetia bacterium]
MALRRGLTQYHKKKETTDHTDNTDFCFDFLPFVRVVSEVPPVGGLWLKILGQRALH